MAERKPQASKTSKASSRETSGHPLDHTTKVDPTMRVGRASSWRIWAFGIAIAVVLGVVIYGVGVQHETPVTNAPQANPNAQTQGQGGSQQ